MKISSILAITLSLVNPGLIFGQSEQTPQTQLASIDKVETSIDIFFSAYKEALDSIADRKIELNSINDQDLSDDDKKYKKSTRDQFYGAFGKAIAAKIDLCTSENDARDLGDTYALLKNLLDINQTEDQKREKIANILEIPADQVPAGLGTGKIPAQIQKRINEAVQLQRLKILAQHYNYEALDRSIKHLQEKYADSYGKGKEFLAKLEELKKSHPDVEKTVNEAKIKDIPLLSDLVNFRLNALYYSNPEVDFDEFLAVKRCAPNGQDTHRAHDRAANWQGITNMGGGRHYKSDILAINTRQIDKSPRTLLSSKRWLGHIDMDFPGDKIMFTSHIDKTQQSAEGLPKGRKEVWNVYELDLKSGKSECLTAHMPQDTDSSDSAYLPDGRILFLSTAGMQGVPCVNGSDWVGNIHQLDRKTNKVRRLTFDQDNNWFPTLLHNGRVMFLRWEYTESAHYFSRVLMHMNPDGTDQKEYYGSNSYWPNSLFNARDIPGKPGMFVGIVTGHHGTNRVGELVLFDTNKGRTETQGAIQKLPGYGKEVPNITKDHLVDGIPTPYFAEPYPLSENYFLASSTVFKGHGLMNIVLSDTFDNIVPLTSSSYFLYAEPYPLKPRQKPPVIPDRIKPEMTTATAYVADIHLGRAVKGIPKGEAKYLRVFSSDYSPRGEGDHYAMGMESNWDVKILYGTVPLNEDGSAIFEMPANEPVTVQVLDKDLRSLAIMRSWFTAMPGEVLSCVGCHENQNDVSPVRITMASRQKPAKITPFHGPVRTYSFANEMQEILDRNCISCHNATTKEKMGLPDFATLTPAKGKNYHPHKMPGSVAYWSLHPFVRRNGPEGDYRNLRPTEFLADTSELVQILKKGHYGVKLNKEDWERLYTWIDMNAHYQGAWEGKNRYGLLNEDVIKRRYELMKEYSTLTRHYVTMTDKDFTRKVTVPENLPTIKKDLGKPVAVNGFPFTVEQAGKQESLDLGNGVKMNLREIPAGKFAMGSISETPSEAPMSAVDIKKPFYMGETEVTLEQYRQFDPTYENGFYDMHFKDQVRPGYEMNNPKFPVIRVSWEKAMEFCKWLSKKTGKKVTLPTEAQWEYAARAGSDKPFYFGEIGDDFSQYANLADIKIKETAVSGVDPKPIKNPDRFFDFVPRDEKYDDGVLHLAEVGKYKPNAFGLYDMIGNVAEWTRSKYQPYPWKNDASRDDISDTYTDRAVRGGSWRDRPVRATASWRWGYPGWRPVYNVGFRVIIED